MEHSNNSDSKYNIPFEEIAEELRQYKLEPDLINKAKVLLSIAKRNFKPSRTFYWRFPCLECGEFHYELEDNHDEIQECLILSAQEFREKQEKANEAKQLQIREDTPRDNPKFE